MAEREQRPIAFSFNVETPNHLIKLMTDQGVHLPKEIGTEQMANIRLVTVTRRLHQIPFELIKIDDNWFIDQVIREDLRPYLKRGDHLLIVQKTLLIDRIDEKEILQLIRFSKLPLIFWVTWDPDPFLKYLTSSRQTVDDRTCINAKAYLLQTRSYAEISLYDHLALMLSHTLQKPSEDRLLTDVIRSIQYPILESNLRSAYVNEDLPMLKIYRQLLQSKSRESLRSNDFIIKSVPSMIDLANHCADAGYGISMNEMILLWSAMKKLNNRIKCQEMKLWGKIFGLYCDYYIIQVFHHEDIFQEEIDILSLPKTRPKKTNDDAAMKPTESSSMEIPMEPFGTGTNRYIYFVCNCPGLPWMKLPHVTPKMIDEARKIRSFFTGCLSTMIDGYGPEKNYLRAQIARISASTHISPAGFYILSNSGEEAEEEIENSDNPTVVINPEFNTDPDNQITAQSLANKELQEWVHSLPEILPQGRTRFWRSDSPLTFDVSIGEDDETIDEQRSDNSNQIQIPSPLLQPINEDQPSWSIGLTMSIMQEFSLCYVRSNRWPGAFTLGDARNHFNLYIGWGQKNDSFHPPIPVRMEKEYSIDLIEVNDPTVEQEKKFEQRRAADSTLGDLTSSGEIESEGEAEEEIE